MIPPVREVNRSSWSPPKSSSVSDAIRAIWAVSAAHSCSARAWHVSLSCGWEGLPGHTRWWLDIFATYIQWYWYMHGCLCYRIKRYIYIYIYTLISVLPFGRICPHTFGTIQFFKCFQAFGTPKSMNRYVSVEAHVLWAPFLLARAHIYYIIFIYFTCVYIIS